MSDRPRSSPIRVLHVVDRLARGGAETWLYTMARHIDRQRFKIDVLVHTDEPKPYDQPMRELGCDVLPCLAPARPWRYARAFGRIAREHGPYDIIHCHTHFWNGVVLWLAQRHGIPVRIAHSRVASTIQEQRGGARRALYRTVMRRLIHRCATHGFAVSRAAAAGLYGEHWQSDPRWQILRSAVDLTPFDEPAPPRDLPAALRDHAGPVIGHVGRFHPQKNHRFLVRVFEAIAQRDARPMFAFVGTGALEQAIRADVQRSATLRERVFFLGDRTDVPALLCHRIELLMLPSLWEGLPRVAIEAQAAGRPALLSDRITDEAAAVPELVRRLPIDDEAEAVERWASEAMAMLDQPSAVARKTALARLRDSDFTIERNVERLQRIYEAALSR